MAGASMAVPATGMRNYYAHTPWAHILRNRSRLERTASTREWYVVRYVALSFVRLLKFATIAGPSWKGVFMSIPAGQRQPAGRASRYRHYMQENEGKENT